VPNGGKSHVTSINFILDLHRFLTLLKVSSKSHCKVLNEKLLIDCNKNIMMTSEHDGYIQTKFGEKRSSNSSARCLKGVVTSKCARKAKRNINNCQNESSWEKK
jgi:methionine salvage enolase-phosphatase E1